MKSFDRFTDYMLNLKYKLVSIDWFEWVLVKMNAKNNQWLLNVKTKVIKCKNLPEKENSNNNFK